MFSVNNVSNEVFIQAIPIVQTTETQTYPNVRTSETQTAFTRVLDSETQTPSPRIQTTETQTTFPNKRVYFDSLTDAELIYTTGLERERFEIIFSMIQKFAPLSESHNYSQKDGLLITLFKLRHNLDFSMMEFNFQINRQIISNVFAEGIEKMFFVFKRMDIWNMSYQDTKLYRCLLDCTEIFVVRVDDPSIHQLTFSTYKHHPTFKILVACDEYGAVIFISDAFPGSISDREIIIKSGILEKFKEGEAVMADKGFDISDLLESKGVLVNIPPFLKGKCQFSSYEVMKTRIIANKRILIENVNARAKKNKIISTTLAKNLWPLANKIIYVCFALVNFYRPLK